VQLLGLTASTRELTAGTRGLTAGTRGLTAGTNDKINNLSCVLDAQLEENILMP